MFNLLSEISENIYNTEIVAFILSLPTPEIITFITQQLHRICNKITSKASVLIPSIYDIPSFVSKRQFFRYIISIQAFNAMTFYPQFINYNCIKPCIIIGILLTIAILPKKNSTFNYFLLLVLFNITILFLLTLLNNTTLKNILFVSLYVLSTYILEFILTRDYFYNHCVYFKLITLILPASITLIALPVSDSSNLPNIRIVQGIIISINFVLNTALYIKEKTNPKYCVAVHIIAQKNEDITHKHIYNYKDGRIKYSTETDILFKIVETASVDYITYEINNSMPSIFTKFLYKLRSFFSSKSIKTRIECQLKNGDHLNFDTYKYTNDSWTIFIKNEIVKQTITFINNDKIQYIYQKRLSD